MTSYDTAADAIMALINSKPRSPTKEELVAVLAAHLGSAPWSGSAGLRAEWCAATAACHAVEGDVTLPDDKFLPIAARVDECAERILARPVVSLGDLKLLAEAVYWVLWNETGGLASPDADAHLADGPEIDIQPGDGTAEALATLLRAIRDMPGSVAPQIVISQAGRIELKRWDAYVRKHLANTKVADKQRSDDQLDAHVESIWARPCRGLDDLALRAAMVVHYHSIDQRIPYPECLIAREYGCTDERSVAFLVRGILDLAGLKFDAGGRLLQAGA